MFRSNKSLIKSIFNAAYVKMKYVQEVYTGKYCISYELINDCYTCSTSVRPYALLVYFDTNFPNKLLGFNHYIVLYIFIFIHELYFRYQMLWKI